VRLGDLFYWQGFAAKLAEVMEYHNFMLTRYYHTEPVDNKQTLEELRVEADQIEHMVAEIVTLHHELREAGANILN
jgi:adenylosuccinate synthase